MWSIAGSTDYNTSTVIDANIWSFPVSTGDIQFKAFLESDGTQLVQLDNVSIFCADFQTEVGQVSTDETWASVSFVNTYTDPVVVASPWYVNNTIPASVRIRSVDSESMEIRLHNPSGSDLSADTITYWVVEAGTWTHNGVRIEAHTHDTSTVGSNGGTWTGDSMTYNHTYGADPLVLHQVMSENDTDWIASFVSDDGTISEPPDTSGFWLALNGAEVATSHGSETIGWIAMDETTSGVAGSTDYENEITPDTIEGYDDGCFTRTYTGSYAEVPYSVVAQQEQDGNNGGWLVQCSGSIAQIGITVDEDQVGDAERAHTTETAGWISFDGAFSYTDAGGGGGGGSYVASGQITSSAFDTGDASSFQVIEWDEDLTSCTGCDVTVQVRTAPDSGGSPGTWTDWYGAGGASTNFEEPQGTVVSNDLNGNQWVQYLVNLTGNGSTTPILEEIRLNYR